MLRVFPIPAGFLFQIAAEIIPAVHLRPAAQAGTHVVGPVLIPQGDQVILIPQGGSWADQGHFSLEDIPQLGQLVQTGHTQETPHRRNITGRARQIVGGHVVGRIGTHGAEFINAEQFLVHPHPLLGKDHPARAVQPDRQRDQQKQRA